MIQTNHSNHVLALEAQPQLPLEEMIDHKNVLPEEKIASTAIYLTISLEYGKKKKKTHSS